jgi:hypothetical protein
MRCERFDAWPLQKAVAGSELNRTCSGGLTRSPAAPVQVPFAVAVSAFIRVNPRPLLRFAVAGSV